MGRNMPVNSLEECIHLCKSKGAGPFEEFWEANGTPQLYRRDKTGYGRYAPISRCTAVQLTKSQAGGKLTCNLYSRCTKKFSPATSESEVSIVKGLGQCKRKSCADIEGKVGKT